MAGRGGEQRPLRAATSGRIVSRRDRTGPDDAGDGRVRVPGRDASAPGMARHSGAGSDGQGPERRGSKAAERVRRAGDAQKRLRAEGAAARGGEPAAALDRARQAWAGNADFGVKIQYVSDTEV